MPTLRSKNKTKNIDFWIKTCWFLIQKPHNHTKANLVSDMCFQNKRLTGLSIFKPYYELLVVTPMMPHSLASPSHVSTETKFFYHITTWLTPLHTLCLSLQITSSRRIPPDMCYIHASEYYQIPHITIYIFSQYILMFIQLSAFSPSCSWQSRDFTCLLHVAQHGACT